MARILVTGYGGFLGQEIVRQLLAAGFEVRGLARGEYPRLRALGIETFKGDITSRVAIERACRDCQGIVHTAAKAGVWGPWQAYYRVNTQATELLLEAAQAARVQAFVYTSSPSVTFNGTPQSGVDESVGYPQAWLCHYPHTKALAEQAVIAAAAAGRMMACALRPHLIWGPGDPHLFPRVVLRAKQGRLRRIGNGENLIDVVHVQSAAAAHVQALQKLLRGEESLNGQALFITDGRPIACWDWISRILAAADVPIPQKSLSFPAAYRLGALLEAAYRVTRRRGEPPLTRFVAAQLALDHYFSIDRARRLIGYDPDIDFETEFERCRPALQRLGQATRNSPKQ